VKKIAILMVLMMGLLALAGCSSDNTSKMVDYTLRTTVTDEATGDPIEGVTISVAGKEMTTDANGLAQTNLVFGTYDVKVDAYFYGDVSKEIVINGSDINLNVSLSNNNIISNGDFASALGSDWDSWWGDQWSGGLTSGTVKVVNEELKIALDSVGTVTYNPKIFYKGIELKDSTDYILSFDARADIARDIAVNIGEQIDVDPWFYDVGGSHTVSLNTEMQRYTIEFNANMTQANFADIIFELGTGDATTFYIDNIYLYEASSDLTGEASPETVPAAPSLDSADVISLHNSSGTYDDKEIKNWNPDWGQGGSITDNTVDGKTIKLLDLVNYQGIAIDEESGLDISGKTTLHISYWTPDATKISVYPIDLDSSEEQLVTDTLVQNEWASLEIDLSNAENVDLSKLMQLKITGQTNIGGANEDGACTIYMDNIYFH